MRNSSPDHFIIKAVQKMARWGQFECHFLTFFILILCSSKLTTCTNSSTSTMAAFHHICATSSLTTIDWEHFPSLEIILQIYQDIVEK